jgi:hypothetical protein
MQNSTSSAAAADAADAARQPTAWQDWLVLAYASTMVLLLVTGTVAVVRHRKYAPLKARNVPLLATMSVAGAVHIAAVVIVDEHFLWLSAVEHTSCVLWNYWLQYFFGLCAWFAGVLLRLLTYGTAFSTRLSNAAVERSRRYRWMAAFAIVAPLLLAFLWLTASHASYLADDDGRCHSALAFKLVVLVWVCWWTASLAVLACVLHHWMDHDYANEMAPLWQLMVVGVLAVFFNGYVVFSDLMGDVNARFTATVSVTSLHAFSFLRFAAVPVYKALRSDAAYATRFGTDVRGYRLPLEDMREAPRNASMNADFLRDCAEKHPFCIGEATVVPACLVACLTSMDGWCAQHDSLMRSDTQQASDDFAALIDTYLTEGRPSNIRAPPELVQRARRAAEDPDRIGGAAEALAEWIRGVLSHTFAAQYLQRDLRARPVYQDAALQTEIARAQRDKVFGRMQRAGLLDAASTRTELAFETPDAAAESWIEMQSHPLPPTPPPKPNRRKNASVMMPVEVVALDSAPAHERPRPASRGQSDDVAVVVAAATTDDNTDDGGGGTNKNHDGEDGTNSSSSNNENENENEDEEDDNK